MKNRIRKISALTVLVIALLLNVKCTTDDDPIDNLQNESGTFTDARDNTTYTWVKIGNQTWMSETWRTKQVQIALPTTTMKTMQVFTVIYTVGKPLKQLRLTDGIYHRRTNGKP